MQRFAWVLIGSIAAVSPLLAQDKDISKGTWELGAMGRVVKYPGVYDTHGAALDHTGVGGRIGYFFAKNWTIEADGSYNETDLVENQPAIPATTNYPVARLRYRPFHLQIVYNAPLSEHASWMFGAGGNYTVLGASIDRKDPGLTGRTGLRWRPSHRWNIRAEGVIDYLPKGFLDKSNTYLAGELGISLMLGHGCNHANDMVSIQPTSADLQPAQTETFTATATYCGKPDQVVYRLTGVGTLDSLTGLYTATTIGTAQVAAYSLKGKMTSVATVTVAAPPAP
ncbi:MAG: outer membrane beta-barrel protein, partial [Gemmatimonadales bacterium]